MTQHIAIKGTVAIAKAVGLNRKDIGRMVREKKLPAFKLDGKSWVALPEDLEAWLRTQRDLAFGVEGDADRS
ncbi:MAG: helix-turn-helix domain-containing protein [Holophaga sp.]|nr:helix-turn-helix domain-containing protein [Holophaga sp.]